LAKRDSSTRTIEELDEKCKLLLDVIDERREVSVQDVVSRAVRKGFKDYEAARALHKLKMKGLVDLMDPEPPRRFTSYLTSSRCTWFWLLTFIVILTILTIYVFPQITPFIYLRYALGSIFVLYLPGASLIELLYPKEHDLSQLERVALSIGLSLALVPLTGLALNYTPWGIRLDPVVAALSVLTVALALGAAFRKYLYHKLKHGV